MQSLYRNMQNKIRSAKGLIEYQLTVGFLVLSLVSILAVLFALLFDSGLRETFFVIANSCQFVGFIVIIAFYLSDKIKVRTALLALASVALLEIVAEMFYCAINASTFTLSVISTNMSVCLALVYLAIMSHIRYFPVILAFVASIVFIISSFLSGSEDLASLSVIIGFICMGVGISGEITNKGIQELEKENTLYEKDQERVLNMLQINQEGLDELAHELTDKNTPPIRTIQLLKLLEKRIELFSGEGKEPGESLDNHFSARLASYCPELAEDEQKICLLILQGESIRDITQKFNISTTTFTETYNLIRIKLDLPGNANLQEELTRIAKQEV